MKKPGFTLIELLVTATIIIVLMGIGVVSFTSAAKTSRDAKRKADLEAIRQALVLKKSETGKYANSGTLSTYATVVALVSTYISGPTPVDPKNDATGGYVYTGNASQTDFCVCAKMESSSGNAGAASSSVTCQYTGNTYYCVSNP